MLYAARLPCFTLAPSFSLSLSLSLLPLSLIDATQLVSPLVSPLSLSHLLPVSLSPFLVRVSFSSSRRGARSFSLSVAALCAASGLLVPLCSRSFVQYSVRERGRGGRLKAGGWEGGRGQGERSSSGGGSLARANPTDSRNTIPPLVGGLRMVRSHDRNQPGRRREREPRERSGKTPGSLANAE